MGQKMEHAPVYFTLAQIKFNPILNLESFLPSIQSQFRRIKFADYKNQILQQLIFGGSESAPSVAPQTRHMFGNIDGSTTFVVDNSSLTLQTTNYDTFDSFSECLLNGLSILNDVIELDFTERIGLRYLDAVQPKQGLETLATFLVPEVLGVSGRLTGTLFHSVSETFTETEAGNLISRVIIQNGTIGLPVDLAAVSPNLNQKFTNYNGLHATIDTDGFLEKREEFDLEILKTRLHAIHEEIQKSFKATVTSEALNIWQ